MKHLHSRSMWLLLNENNPRCLAILDIINGNNRFCSRFRTELYVNNELCNGHWHATLNNNPWGWIDQKVVDEIWKD